MQWHHKLREAKLREVKRRHRLYIKSQKAGAVGRISEVLSKPSWNKRFAAIAAMRAA